MLRHIPPSLSLSPPLSPPLLPFPFSQPHPLFLPLPPPPPLYGNSYADSPSVGRHWSKYNNRAECEQNSGTWFTEYGYIDIDTTAVSEGVCSNRNTSLTRGYSSVWAYAKWGDSTKQCLILGPAPQCLQVGWSRANHNGNGRDGVPLNYTWRLPHFLNNVQKLAVVRIR